MLYFCSYLEDLLCVQTIKQLYKLMTTIAMSSELIDAGSTSDVPHTQAPSTGPKEHIILNLTQLKAKLLERPTLKLDTCYVTETQTMIFEDCDRKLPRITNKIQQRLQIGFEPDPSNAENMRAIWAYVHAQSKSPEIQNQVSYYSDDDRNVDIRKATLKDLHEPFRYIESLGQARGSKGLDKLRFLVLMYFLEKGYLDKIDFLQHGFNELRNAIAVIAKARKGAGLSPTRQSSNSSSVSYTSFQSGDQSVAGTPPVLIELHATDSAAKSFANTDSLSPIPNKREREKTQDDAGFEREFV